jgi:hypothetical protein
LLIYRHIYLRFYNLGAKIGLFYLKFQIISKLLSVLDKNQGLNPCFVQQVHPDACPMIILEEKLKINCELFGR